MELLIKSSSHGHYQCSVIKLSLEALCWQKLQHFNAVIIILVRNQKHHSMWKQRTTKKKTNSLPFPRSQPSKNQGRSHSRWWTMCLFLGLLRPFLWGCCSQGYGSSAPFCPQQPCPRGSNAGRHLVLNEMTPALICSNVMLDCVYGQLVLCQEWGGGGKDDIFRFSSPSGTRSLFINITQKWVQQMVPALAVLSQSCAWLKRLFQYICPTHHIMPWSYLSFALVHTTAFLLGDSATIFTSSIMQKCCFSSASRDITSLAPFSSRRLYIHCLMDNVCKLLWTYE